MTGALALTAALMGLAATPHCATMCAGLCAAASSDSTRGPSGPAAGNGAPVHATAAPSGCTSARPDVAPVLLGRMVGYAAAGALAAGVYQSLHWLGDAVGWAKPFWHVAQGLLLALGLLLLWRGSFPAAWVSRAEAVQTAWRQRRGQVAPSRSSSGRRFSLALLWPLLPCGALHAALLVAALASTPLEGAFVMLVFGIASSPGLLLGERLWRTIRDRWVTLQGHARALTPAPAATPAAQGWAPVQWARAGTVSTGSLTFADTLPLRLAGAALAASIAWGLVGARWFPVLQAWCA